MMRQLPIYFSFLVVFTRVLFSGNTMAQTYSNKPSSIVAPLIGITSTSLVNDTSGYKSGINFNGGFYYAVMLNDRLNMAMELMYTGKGIKSDSPIVKYRYYYVDVPLYLQVEALEGFRINVGGQYSKFTNSQIVTIDGSKGSGTKTLSYNNIKDQDYSVLLGLELNMTPKMVVAARYTLSGSTFFEKYKPNFGVFNLTFRYSIYQSHRVFFGAKE